MFQYKFLFLDTSIDHFLLVLYNTKYQNHSASTHNWWSDDFSLTCIAASEPKKYQTQVAGHDLPPGFLTNWEPKSQILSHTQLPIQSGCQSVSKLGNGFVTNQEARRQVMKHWLASWLVGKQSFKIWPAAWLSRLVMALQVRGRLEKNLPLVGSVWFLQE